MTKDKQPKQTQERYGDEAGLHFVQTLLIRQAKARKLKNDQAQTKN